jgi:hypothetical protein
MARNQVASSRVHPSASSARARKSSVIRATGTSQTSTDRSRISSARMRKGPRNTGSSTGNSPTLASMRSSSRSGTSGASYRPPRAPSITRRQRTNSASSPSTTALTIPRIGDGIRNRRNSTKRAP